jgi:hypothetical protein
MDAYLVMDQNTRKNMEGLLKTWKMPVPESMDPRPVFQADVTQDIENALAKFRAAQQQIRPQHALPPRPPSLNVAWRGTSTPPQTGPRYAAPNDPRARPVSLYYCCLQTTANIQSRHNLRLLSMGHHLTQPHHLHTNSLSNTLSPCHRLTLLT